MRLVHIRVNITKLPHPHTFSPLWCSSQSRIRVMMVMRVMMGKLSYVDEDEDDDDNADNDDNRKVRLISTLR